MNAADPLHATMPENPAALAGLTSAQAAARLASDGPNVLPATRRSTPLVVAGEVMREPMFGLLLAAGALYAVLGDRGEALLLLLCATISVSIAIIQRGRSERVLEALQELTSPRAQVVREGQRQRIPGRDVVTGDLLVLAEGDRVAADAVLIQDANLRVAEAMLTGESIPVSKEAAAGGENSKVYSGTLVVAGTGLARVTATGPRTQLAQLGASMRSIEPEVPRLQAQTRRLVAGFAIAGLVVSLVVVVLYSLRGGTWIEALLAGIALGMAMLPEEFPLVLTVFMVMGAWRLSRSRVLTRRATAIDTLGAATVLCTDKTGTLTRNAMSVVCLEAGTESWAPASGPAGPGQSTALSGLLATAALASEPQGHDPMDNALVELARQAGINADGVERVRTYPLRRDLLAVTHALKAPVPGALRIASKGAPEAIARLCRLGPAEQERLMQHVDRLAGDGIRVLAVARGSVPEAALPEDAAELALELVGLVGFADPLRDSVPSALRECHEAGIRVVMITGDYPQTAQAIARDAGFESGDCLSGQDLERLSDKELAARIGRVVVFARVTPSQKLRIVNAFKSIGETVAMTGDGVNDAPALKAAHMGIAMGGRGTDVAREAAALVLLDDDFGSIVRAIRLGRRIYDNLRKAMSYILAVHVPIAGLALLPLLGGAPLVLTPLLIALLELIIDPTCSIVLEAEEAEPDVMRRPPRDGREPIMSAAVVWWSGLQGLLALLTVAAVYLHTMGHGLPQDEVRFCVFLALVEASFVLVLANRGGAASVRAALGGGNPMLLLGAVVTGALLVLLMSWPLARQFLGISPPGPVQLLLSLGSGVALLCGLQAIKALRLRLARPAAASLSAGQ